VADGFGSNGLVDIYLKTRYQPKDNFSISLDAHHFVLPSAVKSETGSLLSKRLGTEIDVVFNYALTKLISLEGGYSFMASTSTLSSVQVKNVRNADRFSQWAYLMFTIKPETVIDRKLK